MLSEGPLLLSIELLLSVLSDGDIGGEFDELLFSTLDACKVIKYCNVNCQKHWKEGHKQECKETVYITKINN